MRDEPAQRREESLGALLDGGAPVARLAVGPLDGEPAVDDAGRHVDEVATPRAWAVRGPGRLARPAEGGRRRERLIELPQVVEAGLGLRQRGERGGDGLARAQVAEQPMADAAARHGPELLLDGLDRRGRS